MELFLRGHSRLTVLGLRVIGILDYQDKGYAESVFQKYLIVSQLALKEIRSVSSCRHRFCF